MTTTANDKIAQYLHEAHGMELALTRSLQAHRAVTPTGPYRRALDRHLRETRGHANRIEKRLHELGDEPGLADRGIVLAQRVAEQALALGKVPLELVRGSSAEEKLLKNAKDDCASEAREIATYDALEELAWQADDEATAKLAADHRADEERMLAALREQLPTLTAAVVGAEIEGESSFDPSRTGAGQAVSKTRRAAGAVTHDAVHAVRSTTGTLGTTQEREEDRSPFAGYDELTVEEITARLGDLTPAHLRHVATYERVHKDRRGVIEAVERRQEELEQNHTPS